MRFERQGCALRHPARAAGGMLRRGCEAWGRGMAERTAATPCGSGEPSRTAICQPRQPRTARKIAPGGDQGWPRRSGSCRTITCGRGACCGMGRLRAIRGHGSRRPRPLPRHRVGQRRLRRVRPDDRRLCRGLPRSRHRRRLRRWPRGAMAVAMLFWSGAWPSMRPPSGGPEVAVAGRGWTGGGRRGAGGCHRQCPPPAAAGATALGEGMAAGLALLARCPAPATRLVLDVSGDGRHNQGRLPGPVRDIGVAAGRHPQWPGGAERGAGPARPLPGRGDRRHPAASPWTARTTPPSPRPFGKSWRGRSAGFSCPGWIGYLPGLMTVQFMLL